MSMTSSAVCSGATRSSSVDSTSIPWLCIVSLQTIAIVAANSSEAERTAPRRPQLEATAGGEDLAGEELHHRQHGLVVEDAVAVEDAAEVACAELLDQRLDLGQAVVGCSDDRLEAHEVVARLAGE